MLKLVNRMATLVEPVHLPLIVATVMQGCEVLMLPPRAAVASCCKFGDARPRCRPNSNISGPKRCVAVHR